MTLLQKSVQAVLIGKTHGPDWLSQGIPEKSRVVTTILRDVRPPTAVAASEAAGALYTSLASSGRYVYIHSCHGLIKVGSGYGNTIMVCLYQLLVLFLVLECGFVIFLCHFHAIVQKRHKVIICLKFHAF